jgi:hypothetical protein
MASMVHDFSTTKKYGKPTKFRYVKMISICDLKGPTIGEEISENINYTKVVKTYNYSSYSKLKDQVWCHIPQEVRSKEAEKVLLWVQTMKANAKRTLLGIHYMISNKYSQNYLDEFCNKVNRKNLEDQLFDGLLIACITSNYQNIVNNFRLS